MKKRKWVYLQNPKKYEISCDLCGGNNIEWSEFAGMIWCYDCKKDTRGNGGVFDGPIPINAAGFFGLTFDRYYFKENEVRRYEIRGNKIKYVPFCCPIKHA